MAEQSKVAQSAMEALIDLLVGSKKKKFITATVLLIIAFLLQIRDKKAELANIKLKPEKKVSLHFYLGRKRKRRRDIY
jgi:hypothetical protein